MNWRPKDGWDKCPCDDCQDKNDDAYGRFCDLACGKWTAWNNHEAGADQILTYLEAEIEKMENPYNYEDECSLYTGYGQFRQDILKLLEE